MQNYFGVQEMNQCPFNQGGNMPAMEGCQAIYPEAYYKIQPFVMSTCDQMKSFGGPINAETLDQMSDDIYTNVCTMYPEFAEYANQCNMASSVETAQRGWEYSPGYGGFRRRGMFRDFIDTLLLFQLFR